MAIYTYTLGRSNFEEASLGDKLQRDQVTGQWNAITDTRIDYITTDIQLIGIRREREGTPIREKGNHERGNATVRSERDEPES